MSKKYKVLLSAYACEPNRGSEPGVGWNWALEIAKRGHDVTVLTRSNNKHDIDLFLSKNKVNLNFIYYDLPKSFLRLKKIMGVNFYYSLWQLGIFFYVREYFKKNKFDLIHHITFGVFRQISYLSFLKIPFVFGPVGGGERAPMKLRKSFTYKDWIKDLIRDFLNELTFYNPFYRLMLKRSVLVLVKTKETLTYIPKKYHNKTIIHLEIGINEINSTKRNVDADSGKFKILCVSRFISLKALHMVLFSVAELNSCYDNIELTIVGTGPLEKKLKKIQSIFKMTNVKWIPWVNQNDLKFYYQDADIFLFPSLHDSSGNVVLESISNSLPVICLDLGGPVEIIGESDLVISTKNKSEEKVINAITERIEKIILDPKSLLDYRIKAEKRANDFFWYKTVGKIYSILEINNIKQKIQ